MFIYGTAEIYCALFNALLLNIRSSVRQILTDRLGVCLVCYRDSRQILSWKIPRELVLLREDSVIMFIANAYVISYLCFF